MLVPAVRRLLGGVQRNAQRNKCDRKIELQRKATGVVRTWRSSSSSDTQPAVLLTEPG